MKKYNIYYANGKQISVRSTPPIVCEGGWTECTLDTHGNTTGYHQYNADGALEWLHSWDATYDERGNLLTRTYYNVDGSVRWWVEYTYDANGNKTSERCYNADGTNIWRRSSDNTYDANNNLLTHISYTDDGRVDFLCKYTYDAHGNRTSRRCYNGAGIMIRAF